ncbi:Gfo/Idh/MocA family protein [Draconibacterium sediminis]|uniref:Dehydrogenase n=1 Tax=Draconibacterium sediminis TaxID=1544798 RepID=A0A0D8JEZ8_9BACT|nr:Gfo/Idh/MocA family oxidoreductase [Draconibacterium sediminis]KJF45121.1 dehydrogenase [Draconibacterium sediminis]
MSNFSRRGFIQSSMVGAAGLTLMPWSQVLATGANDTIRIGFIGLGQQAMNLLNGFSQIKGVEIVAGADCYGVKRERFELKVNEFYKARNQKVDVKTYKDYREIIDRKDIDAVVIATPDHWHAIMAIDACEAGKDIYQEKPITFTIKESIMVAAAVRKHNVIFATGSQQRSDNNYQHAVNMVHREAFGKLTKVNAYVGPGPDPYNLPKEEVPADLDWKQWLGPMPYVHYNQALNPPITIDPETKETFWARWRYYKETGGGFTCDWGAHNFDIGQWGLKKDHSGPVEVIPPGYKGTKFLTYVYDNGVTMTNEAYDDKNSRGVKFWGEDGWIEVSRQGIWASDPVLLPEKEAVEAGMYEKSSGHLENFINAVRMRIDPIVPVEIGARTAICSILGNVAYELQRPVAWSPEEQYFINDPEAEKFYHREYENGYKL